MAIVKTDEKEVEVKDGSILRKACEELGVLFPCGGMGVCGGCLVEILEGAENLTEPTDAEKDMFLESNQRLACQCKIMRGTVKITF